MFGSKKNEDQQVDVEFFAIYDSKSNSYERTATARNHLVLIRELQNMFKDPQNAMNPLYSNPEDFKIFRIATYDKSTGYVTPVNLEHIANLHDIRAAVLPTRQETEVRALSST